MLRWSLIVAVAFYLFRAGEEGHRAGEQARIDGRLPLWLSRADRHSVLAACKGGLFAYPVLTCLESRHVTRFKDHENPPFQRALVLGSARHLLNVDRPWTCPSIWIFGNLP